MQLKKNKTERGFKNVSFKDRYDNPCSIQKSSLATESAIWFGIDDPNPLILAVDAYKLGIPGGTPYPNGWVSYPLPKEVLVHDRMHLTQKQVKKLLPILKHFAETGELP